MTTAIKDNKKPAIAASPAAPSVSPWLDRFTALFSLWLVGGLFLDGWAHRNLPNLETFFTPWHAVLYSGYAVLAASLVLTAIRNRLRNGAGVKLLPPGYEFALAGAALFAAGGVGDMLWHIAFGTEVSVSALLSPTHLILALAAWMMITAPIRSARFQMAAGSFPAWKAVWPSILAFALALSLVTFFMQFGSPIAESWVFGNTDPGVPQQFSIVSLILAGMILLGAVLIAQSLHWPFGAMTILLGLNTLAMCVLVGDFLAVPVGVVAGLAADFFVKRALSKPSLRRVATLGAVVPAAFVAVLLLEHAIIGDLKWVIHLWAGSIVMVALFGALFALASFPRAGSQADAG